MSILDENANSYTLKDKVDSIEVGYEQQKTNIVSIDKSIIKLDNIKELADYEGFRIIAIRRN